jgi:small subunit ribosomal protein S4
MALIKDSLRSNRSNHHEWLEWNDEKMEGRFLIVPERSMIPENIKEQLIVELYSK